MIVTAKNGSSSVLLHESGTARTATKIIDGKIVEEVNSFDSFSFDIYPNHPMYYNLHEMKTIVKAYNTRRNRYEFVGRVLYASDKMDSYGLICKSVICESRMAYLCDSIQPYIAERQWEGDDTRNGLQEFIDIILENHNAQVTEEKQIFRGEVTLITYDSSEGVYKGLNYQKTWDALNDKLLKVFGGEMRVREGEDGKLYLDYAEQFGRTTATEIRLARNMQSLTREINPSNIITRLIPLGAKLKITDEDGNETQTEQRLTIATVNDGVEYVQNDLACEKYGAIYGTQTWDDVTDATNLLRKANEWMIENTTVVIGYKVTALDLATIGLDIDEIDLYNSYPVVNPLMGVDDTLRVIKKTTSLDSEYSSAIELGDRYATMTDIFYGNQSNINDAIAELNGSMTNVGGALDEIRQTIVEQNTTVIRTCEEIILEASQKLVDTGQFDEYRETVSSQLAVLASNIEMNFTTTTEQITNVNGDMQSRFTELTKYIRFSDDGIVIGEEGNALTLTLDNDRIAFVKNGVQIGWWDGNDFHTGNIYVETTERARFGDFAFVPRSDGSLMFLKVGD